ncbi:MAG TPA: hypothetical protein VM053_07450 [Gemmatimonadaceae bacterium]|nr:hypothetical protein [Gemmatimonadaceae bacterium]
MRAAFLWFALHAFLFAVSGGEILALGTKATIVLAVIGAVVGHADTSRRHEYGMLGNLGIAKRTPATTWAGTMVILEIVLRVVSSLAGAST